MEYQNIHTVPCLSLSVRLRKVFPRPMFFLFVVLSPSLPLPLCVFIQLWFFIDLSLEEFIVMPHHGGKFKHNFFEAMRGLPTRQMLRGVDRSRVNG